MSRARRPRSTVAPAAGTTPPRPPAQRAESSAVADTPTSTLSRSLAFAAFAVLAAAWLANGWSADPRAWGVHFLAFLPRVAWFAAAAAFAALLVPSVAESFADAVLRVTGGIVAAWPRTVWVALPAGVLFYVLRLRFQFLGDGIVWLEKIEGRGTFHHFEPLATVLVGSVARLAPTVAVGAAWPSIVCGVVAIPLAGFLCRSLWQDAPARALAWLLLLVHPLILLFFGYVESYPLLYVLQLAFALALLAEGRSGPTFATAILGVAIAMHLQAVAWLPALAILPWARRGLARGETGRSLLQGVGLAALAIGVALILIRVAGASITKLGAELAGDSAFGSARSGFLVPGRRLIDIANELVLVVGSAILVGLPAVAAARALGRPISFLTDPRWVRITVLLPGPALFILIVVPRIGGARDWDLYLSLVLPVTLLAVEGWQRWRLAARRDRGPAIVAGRALGFASIATLAWLWVNLDDSRAAERMVVVQSQQGTFGNFARGYANEALGMYFRQRDLPSARAAYTRATQANPNNARYFNNLANIELQLKNVPAARDGFRRAYELGMKEWFVLQNLAVTEMQLGRPDSAAAAFTILTTRYPDRWMGHAGLAQVQLQLGLPREALVSLARAAALAPKEADVPYFVGVARRDLGETDAARRSFEDALRLDPRHGLARQALDGLPPASP